MSTRAYPLPAPPAAVLSSFGLAYDVGRVFELSGLPRPTPADLGALREVLLAFVYDTDPESPDELLDGLEKARAEEDRIAGELADVRGLHKAHPTPHLDGAFRCTYCGGLWPCLTISALDFATTPPVTTTGEAP